MRRYERTFKALTEEQTMILQCNYCNALMKGNIQTSKGGCACALCTQKLVARVQRLEKEQRKQIRNSKDYRTAKVQDKGQFTCEDLVAVRKAKGWSQTSLAQLLEIDRSYIGHIEAGKKPIPPGVAEWISRNINILPNPRHSSRKLVSNLALKTNKLRTRKKGISTNLKRATEILDEYRCYFCGEIKYDWEISITENDCHMFDHICDDCLAKNSDPALKV